MCIRDRSNPPPEDMWLKVKSLDDAKADAEEIKISFKKGDPIEINDTKYSAAELLKVLNNLGCEHGIGRIDIVESRATGMKSRGCYETPGGTILLKARRAIESLCLSRDEILEKDAFMPSYAKLIYDGLWWSDKRLDLQKRIDSMSEKVCGTINLQLFKGNIITLGKESENSLYDENKASFEAQGGFSNQDMAEHIKKNILEFNK